MDRRLIGAVVLLLAVAAALVAPRVVSPHRVDGRAAVAAAPAPPVVGACLAQSASGYAVSGDGQVQASDPIAVVPCTTTHGAEIVLMEPGLPALTGSDPAQPVQAFTDRCQATTISHEGSADWSPQLNLTFGVVGPDRRQIAAGQAWVGCTAGLLEGELDQPLAALLTGDGPSPELGRCSRWQAGSDSAVTVACTMAHTVEEVGVRPLEHGSSLGQADLAAGCAELVVAATGRLAVTSEPSLAIDTTVSARYGSGTTSPVLAPLPVDAVSGQVTCSVRVTDARRLTASLRLIGDAPLPWAT